MNNLNDVFLHGNGEICYDFLKAYEVNEHGIVIQSKVTGIQGLSKNNEFYNEFLTESRQQKLLDEFKNIKYVGKAMQTTEPIERMIVLYENDKHYIGICSTPSSYFGTAFSNENVTIINKDSMFIDHDANLKLTLNEVALKEKYNTVEKLLGAIERNLRDVPTNEIFERTEDVISMWQKTMQTKTNATEIQSIEEDLKPLKAFHKKLQNTKQMEN